jgi:hypothetical protein
MLRWFRERVVGSQAMSASWLQSQALSDTKVGVDLPRWRFPKERAAMQRRATWQARADAILERRYGKRTA